MTVGSRDHPDDETLRVAILGSYPTWPFREQLRLRRDTRHVTTTWNVNLAEALARRDGLEIEFFTLAAGIPESRVIPLTDNLRIHFLSMPRIVKGLDLALGLRLSTAMIGRELERVSPDVVHGIGTEHPFAHIATTLPYPSVITVHGVMSRVIKAVQVPPWSPKRMFARLERRVLRTARHVITISPYVEEALQIGAGTHTYDIENSIDRVFFEGDLTAVPRSGLAFVGMIQPRKGVDVLLEALQLLPPSDRPKPIMIIGSVVPEYESYARGLREFIAEKGLEEWITFSGGLDQRQLSRALRSVEALVLPSREETAPMVIAEAMACGARIVASDVGGVRHMVRPHATGLIVPPERPAALAEALRQALNDDLFPPREVGRAEAQRRFHPDTVAEATEAVYRKVLADARKQPTTTGQDLDRHP